MRNNPKLVPLLWTVIAALVLGMTIGGYFLVHHASQLEENNTQLNGDNDSLRRQLKEAQATPSPTPTPTATPTPAPTPAAKSAVTPTPVLKKP